MSKRLALKKRFNLEKDQIYALKHGVDMWYKNTTGGRRMWKTSSRTKNCFLKLHKIVTHSTNFVIVHFKTYYRPFTNPDNRVRSSEDYHIGFYDDAILSLPKSVTQSGDGWDNEYKVAWYPISAAPKMFFKCSQETIDAYDVAERYEQDATRQINKLYDHYIELLTIDQNNTKDQLIYEKELLKMLR